MCISRHTTDYDLQPATNHNLYERMSNYNIVIQILYPNGYCLWLRSWLRSWSANYLMYCYEILHIEQTRRISSYITFNYIAYNMENNTICLTVWIRYILWNHYIKVPSFYCSKSGIADVVHASWWCHATHYKLTIALFGNNPHQDHSRLGQWPLGTTDKHSKIENIFPFLDTTPVVH